MQSKLRRYFIAGLIVFLPLAVTFGVLRWLFRVLDGFMGSLFTVLIGHPVPGLGLISTILVVLAMGALATNVLGRRLVERFDRLMLRIPLARSIYSATKSISDTVFAQNRAMFQRPVLIEWPRKGVYTVAFVTGESVGETQEKTPERVLNVFVVTTPNPTTGFLVLVPEDQVRTLDMSLEDALKLVMSGGIVSPPSFSAVAPPTDPLPAPGASRPDGRR